MSYQKRYAQSRQAPRFRTLAEAALSGTGLRSVGVGSLAVAACLMAASAARAEDVSAKPVLVAADAPTPAAVPSANGVEDVTVTAKIRKESILEAPVSITAITGDDLSDRGIERIQQFQFETPSVAVFETNPRQTQIAIRGLGGNSAANGLTSSVGETIDGVYLDRPGMGAIEYWDIQNLEIDRGPSGFNGGKNTTIGSLNFFTNKPTYTPSALIETTFGNYNTQEEKFVLNGPIGDSNKVAVRFSGYNDYHAPYIKDAVPQDDNNRQGARLQFLFDPTDRLEVIWRNEWNIEHDHSGVGVQYDVANQAQLNAYNARNHVQLTVDPNHLVSDANVPQEMFTRFYNSSVTADYKLDNGGTVTSISAFRSYQFRPYNESATGVVPDQDVSRNTQSSQAIEHEQEVTQELRYNSAIGKPVDYTVGAFALWRREQTNSEAEYPFDYVTLAGSAPATNTWRDGALTRTDGTDSTQNFAVYAESHWHIDNRFTLTTGLRETFQEDWATITQWNPTGPNTHLLTPAQLVQYGYYHTELSSYNLNLSELITLNYKIQEGANAYATFSHGTKAGGSNSPAVPPYVGAAASHTTAGILLPSQILSVAPEKSDLGEIGIKSNLPEQHVTFNLAAFLERVFDYQTPQTSYPDASAPTVAYTGLTNVGSATSKGFELETTWKPYFAPDLKLGFTGDYDLATYGSFRTAAAPGYLAQPTQDLSGSPIWGAPRWTAAPSASYDYNISDDINTRLIADYIWKSDQFGSQDNSPYSVIKAYGVANLELDTNFFEKYDVLLFIRNIWDTPVFYSTSYSATTGTYSAQPYLPRTFGVTLRAKW